MTWWHFIVPGEPKGRTNPAAFGFIDPTGKARARQVQTKTTKSFEALVAAFALEALRDVPRLDQPLVLDILAVFPRPGYLDEPWESDGLIIQASKPDRDNIEKALQDGMKAEWRDDCRVSLGSTLKAFAERGGKPRTEVWVRVLDDGEVVEFHGNRVVMAATQAAIDAHRAMVKAAAKVQRERRNDEAKAVRAAARTEAKRAKAKGSPKAATLNLGGSAELL